MGGEKELLELLKRRINEQIFDLETNKILFYAKIDVDTHFSKKNSYSIFRAGRRAFLGKSLKFRKAEDTLLLGLRNAKNRARIIEPIRSDLWLLCIFGFANYYIRKKDRRNKRLNDLSNLYELPQDCLKTARIIEDDTQICSHDLSRRVPSDHNFIELFLIEYDSSL